MHTAKLNHQEPQQAEKIWQLFHNAYEIEAQVLGLQQFPPLGRTIDQITQASSTFFGGWLKTDLVAAIEIEDSGTEQIHINSFGVSPDHFRKGYGTTLLLDVLAELSWQRVTVATAVANTPALQFYKKHGFQPHEQWTTPDNFDMVTLYKGKLK